MACKEALMICVSWVLPFTRCLAAFYTLGFIFKLVENMVRSPFMVIAHSIITKPFLLVLFSLMKKRSQNELLSIIKFGIMRSLFIE